MIHINRGLFTRTLFILWLSKTRHQFWRLAWKLVYTVPSKRERDLILAMSRSIWLPSFQIIQSYFVQDHGLTYALEPIMLNDYVAWWMTCAVLISRMSCPVSSGDRKYGLLKETTEIQRTHYARGDLFASRIYRSFEKFIEFMRANFYVERNQAHLP